MTKSTCKEQTWIGLEATGAEGADETVSPWIVTDPDGSPSALIGVGVELIPICFCLHEYLQLKYKYGWLLPEERIKTF